MSTRSPIIAGIIASALEPQDAKAAMANIRSWAGLRDLIGLAMHPTNIVSNLSTLDRDETFFTLARIAADVANAEGGVLGATARSWTRDLLVRGCDSGGQLEVAISNAVAKLESERAIAHAHVLFFLQVHAIAKGSPAGVIPSDGYMAFMMLAANDHLPEWPKKASDDLTETERSLAPMVLSSIFNRSDDVLRSLVRLVDVMGRHPSRDFPEKALWEAVQTEAFGTSFVEYAEMFLAPMFLLARNWGSENAPIVFPQSYVGRDSREEELYRRWFREASIPIDKAAQEFASRVMPSGLLGLPVKFFRTPFIDFGDKLVALSPWHIRDHLFLGTWAKLNAACKRVLKTDSIQKFASGFGYCFEEACADLAREAKSAPRFRDRLILPSQPGADDEIEDVVFADENVVALLSAKASLVPEASLKTADGYDDIISWFRKFFFQKPDEAKKSGYRGGAIYLLNQKVQRLRAGEYEKYGVKRDATVLPCVLSFDNIGESGVLYKWLEEETQRRGLFTDAGVRPITVITPEDYEALLALGARGDGVCRLLMEKTEPNRRLGPLDLFLHGKVADSVELRLASMPKRFHELVERTYARLKNARSFEQVMHERISRAAYFRWLNGGRRDGGEVDDWLVAERGVRAEIERRWR